jgi:hypothetical protein
MDGDSAGKNAAVKAGERIRLAGAEVHIGLLPNGVDPAQYLAHNAHNLDPFRAANALPLLSVQVQRCIASQGEDMQWIEGKIAAARAIAGYLTTYPADQAVAHAAGIARTVDMPLTTFAMILGQAFTDARALPPPGNRAGDLLRTGAEYSRRESAGPELGVRFAAIQAASQNALAR